MGSGIIGRFCGSLVATLTLVSTGCQTQPLDQLPQTWATLEEQWQRTLEQEYQPDSPVDLAWNEALEQMREENLKLQRAQQDVNRAHDQLVQIYWNLVPTLNIQGRADSRIGDLSSFGWNNLSLDVNGLINIPGLVSFGSNLYGARLSLFRAQVALLLAEREQEIELYQTFRDQQSIDRRRAFLRFAESQASLWQNVDPFQATRQREEIRRTRRNLETDELALQQRIHRLIGLSGTWWRPQSDDLPTWNYLEEPLILNDLRQTGFLQSLLLATELQGAAARLRGVRLQYWPDLSITIAGPPLYQVRGGRGSFWRAEDVRIFANAYWQIDTQGRIGRQVRQIEEENRIQLAELELQASEQARRLQQAQSLYRDLAREAQQLSDEVEVLQELLIAGQGTDPVRNLQAIQTLAEEQNQIERRMDEVYTLFWFVDERRWSFEHEEIHARFPPRED